MNSVNLLRAASPLTLEGGTRQCHATIHPSSAGPHPDATTKRAFNEWRTRYNR